MAEAVINNPAHCRDCGTVISATAPTCPRCGGLQHHNRKSRIAAALFALFLGGVGFHKFYLGRVGWGLLYLLFCWTFIPAVVALIEMIIYLTMTDEAFAAKYG